MELKLQHVTKRYGTKTAVDDINMTLREGIYGLLGANGAGKTSLMRLICLIQNRSGGEITLDGKEIMELKEEYRSFLGYLPQNFGYYPEFTAQKFLLYMSALKGLNKHAAKRRIEELLDVTGLEGDRNKKIKTFSGGMKQRLGIAQAMLNDPHILILDEPTAGLDVMARNEMLDMLRDYMEEDEERSILVSSHISTDLETLCDNIYMINEGNIILHEETDRLLSNYAILKVDEEQSKTLDPQYIIKMKKESYGYACLTDQKQFYLENYPKIVVEKGTIDQIITLMIQGV